MEKEKVDKAALGYDYKGETEKHQSQKGIVNIAWDHLTNWKFFQNPSSYLFLCFVMIVIA